MLKKRCLPIVIVCVLFLSVLAPAQHRQIGSELTEFVPSWALEGGRLAMLQRMIDPALRPAIEQEINEITAERISEPSDMLLPEIGDTLADWMVAFDRETSSDYELAAGQALWSFVNLDYDNGNTLYVDELTVIDLDTGAQAFHYDFSGEDGDTWDPSAFGDDLFVYPRNPNAVRYSIENNNGKLEVEPRRDGTASSYGKLTPIMNDLDNSEVLMRFRVDTLGRTQWLRVWVQSDQFASGSSFAANGYGIALHLGTDKLTLQRREDSSTTNLIDADANMTTDWHWLRLRAAHGKVAVKLWNDEEGDEPNDWNIEYELPKITKTAALSFVNNDPDHASVLTIDEFQVSSPNEQNVFFRHDFENDRSNWDASAFHTLHAYPVDPAVAYVAADQTGSIRLEKKTDTLNASYAKVIPRMEHATEADVFLRFNVSELGDQQLRLYVNADDFFAGNSAPRNGYGAILHLATGDIDLVHMDNKNTYKLGTVNKNITNDSYNMRFVYNENELGVRLWPETENEPAQWDAVYTVRDNISVGETIMRLLMLRGDLEVIYTAMDAT